MHHQRHYTLEQASAVRGWVAERVDLDPRARRTSSSALGDRAREAIDVLDPGDGRLLPGPRGGDVRWSSSAARLSELEAVDVVVRDVDRGLVDFPALRDGEEVYLCWLVDEDEIGYWHAPDAGFAGRRPL